MGRKLFKEITPNLVQKLMRKVAIRADFVDEDFDGKDFNIVSPLR
jgi:hypothetical protein